MGARLGRWRALCVHHADTPLSLRDALRSHRRADLRGEDGSCDGGLERRGFVWQDENAEFASGDRAQQAVMVLRYQPSKPPGLGSTERIAGSDADDSILEVSLIDTAGEWELPVGASDRLRLAAEVAYLTGRTDRSLSEAAVAAGRDTMDLSALGGALVAGFETMNRRLALELCRLRKRRPQPRG